MPSEKKQNQQSTSQVILTAFKMCGSILLMVAIIYLLGWLAMGWIDSFTSHGVECVVPDLKGMSYNDAVERLEKEGLVIELSDSIYDDKLKPGAVLDQNPKGNSKVKPGRVVYVTINAFSPRMVTLPQLTEISLRQARSVLEGIGITDVRIAPVASEYKDLVLGVKCNGRRLLPGARVSIKSVITLEVGDGMPDMPDTIMVDSVNTGAADDFELLNLQ